MSAMFYSRLAVLWWIFIGLVLVRLVSLAFYPLMDTTEARYGEIARIMVETNNWITPQIDYGIPFWGKPPAMFWASAISIEVFGESEFFLRLPHYLAALAVMALVWRFTSFLKFDRLQSLLSIAVVFTSVGFYVAAGTVMTDMLLCLSMVMVMIGFWRGWHGDRNYLYLMYLGLGLGLLIKGPLILVLAGLAILPWIVIDVGFRSMCSQIYDRLGVVTGILILLFIAVPWYWLAERETPGFLQYFLIGEHFERFLVSGWQGDLYGSGHARAKGTIWGYWFLFALPWSPFFLLALGKHLVNRKTAILTDHLNLFLLFWMCSPLILFMFSANVLPAYILPGLPAFGPLLIRLCETGFFKRAKYLSLVSPAILIAVIFYINHGGTDRYSDKAMLEDGVNSKHRIYYLQERPYSAQYYSRGSAKLSKEFPDRGDFYLAVRDRILLADSGKSIKAQLEEHCELRSRNQLRKLYFCQVS